MAFWNRSKKQAPTPEKKSCVSVTLTQPMTDFLQYGVTTGASAQGAKKLYDDSTAVSIPINFIGEAFRSIVPVVEENGKILDKHPILDLLNQPSPDYDRELFFETLGKDYLITGECCPVALGSINRPPIELQPIGPEHINDIAHRGGVIQTFQISGETLIGSYRREVRGRRARYLDGNLREMRLIRSYSTKDNSLKRGRSPLVAASKETRQHILGNLHNAKLLENGGRLSLVFHFEEDMGEDDYNETNERVQSKARGPLNSGSVWVTAGGKLDIKELGTNNKDMDYAILHDLSRQAVALQYKFPLPLLTTDASTMNNYKEAKLALYDDAVLPLADIIFGGLTSLLMPRYGLDPAKVKITYDMDSITALSLRRNEELKLRKELNIETDNELRAMIGREPYEGGDVVLKPANLIPVGTDLFTGDGKLPSLRLLRDTNDEEGDLDGD